MQSIQNVAIHNSELVLLLFTWGFNHFVYTWNQDLAVGIDKSTHKFDEICHGFVDGPAKHARMQVPPWSRDV
jgi:hypothetical protein